MEKKRPDPRTLAATYARVSSKEQEKEGFSIPAQQKLLRGYAAQNASPIAQEFVDVETAKKAGRTGFGEMLAFLKNRPLASSWSRRPTGSTATSRTG